MSQSFAKLLKQSKFAQYDPKVKQIICTFGKAKKVGDWGLKRNLPTTWRSGYITVGAIDTPESLTPFDSAYNQILQNKQFAENFGTPASSKWKGVQVGAPKFYDYLTADEFKGLVNEARERSEEWQEHKKNITEDKDSWAAFLNVSQSLETKTTQAPLVYYSNLGSKTEVQGRILNKNGPNSYVVGVSGFTCHLVVGTKSNNASHSDSFGHNSERLVDANNHSLRTFYVNDFTVSLNNQISIRLSLTPNVIHLDNSSYALVHNYFQGFQKSVDRLKKNNPNQGLQFGLGQNRFKKAGGAKFNLLKQNQDDKSPSSLFMDPKPKSENSLSKLLATIQLKKQ